MKRLYYIVLLLTITFGVLFRVYKIDGPVADWHSWRQSDTAAVARNFLKFGFEPFQPRFDDLSNIPSGLDNPMGWRMVEFPLYQLMGAGMYALTGGVLTIEIWLRIIIITASALSIFFLSEIVHVSYGKAAGLCSGLLYALLPYAVFYGRAILPDQLAVAFALGALYVLMKEKRLFGFWCFISIVFSAISLLVKPYSIFLLIPVPVILYFRWKFTKRLVFALVLYAFFSAFPLWWWRSWILSYPEGIPVYAWLLNANNIRFKAAWFRWLFAERLGNLMLGYWGLVLFATGLLNHEKRKHAWIIRLLGLGSLLYVSIIAAGNVQHDYYQIFVLPAVVAFAGIGASGILRMQSYPLLSRAGVVVISFIFSVGFSWYTIRTFYWINRPDIVEAGKLADELLPKDAKVIAPYNGDTTFLYQTNRQGWPIGFDIDKKKSYGATHYVTVSPSDDDLETKELAETYTVLFRNDRYAIIDITKRKE